MPAEGDEALGRVRVPPSVAQHPDDPKVLRVKAMAEAADKEAKKLKYDEGRAEETGRRQGQADDLVNKLEAAERGLRLLQEQHSLSQVASQATHRSRAAEIPPGRSDGDRRRRGR